MKKIKNENQKIAISENQIHYSQIVEDSETLECKIVICGFGVNGNGVKLNRDTIESWVSTLVNQPLLGKIGVSDTGEADFEGHNFYIVTRKAEDGSVYRDSRFDTSAMGVFTDVSIDTIKGQELITATARVWKRYPEFCAVLKKRMSEGTLKSSWEIAVKKSHKETIGGKTIKVIDEGNFIGHTLLGSVYPPAFNESQVLEVASQNDTQDILEAIQKDIANINPEKEEDVLDKENTPAIAENEDTTVVNTEESVLTEFDLKKGLRQAIAEKLSKDKWDVDIICHMPIEKTVWVKTWGDASELDVKVLTYEVENDVVTVSDPVDGKLSVSISQISTTVSEMQKKIDEQNEALIESSSTIQTLNTQIADLTPFKEKFEKSEQDRIEKELSERRDALKAFALKSGHITETEIEASEADGGSKEIKAFIESVNESAIKDIIADRFVASLGESKKKEDKTVSVESAQAKANISDNDDVIDHKTFMKNYIGGRK